MKHYALHAALMNYGYAGKLLAHILGLKGSVYSGDKKSLKLLGIEHAAADGPATKAQWDSGISAHDLTQLFRRCLMTSQSRLSLRRKRQQLSPHMALLC